MVRLYSFFISLILIIMTALPGLAQVEQDTTVQVADTTVVAPMDPTAAVAVITNEAYSDSVEAVSERFSINLFLDYGKILTLPFDFEQKFEGGLYLRFNRKIALGAEGGKSYTNPHRPYLNGNAEAEGIYYGGFIQYFFHLDSYNSLFLGAGYTMGKFDDQFSYTIFSEVYGEENYSFYREGLEASWATIRIGSEKMLTRSIGIGGVLEVRIKTSFDQPEGPEVYTIPGYGRAGNKSTPALNFYVKFSL